MNARQFFNFVLLSVFLLIMAYAGSGGMRYFNLDLASVYDFRRLAAANMPTILLYVFWNVSNILIPALILLSLYFRKYILCGVVLALAVFLFGMTHHKNVFFLPFLILFFYYALRRVTSTHSMSLFFLLIPVASISHIICLELIYGGEEVSQITSLFVRRFLFVPPLMDNYHVDFFAENPKYWWSHSKFGFGIVDQPYEQTAAFVIGLEYFSDGDMSANTGAIGSGYSNAGLFGVVFYSSIIGALIAMLHAHGQRLGHNFVSTLSLMTILNVVRSTDLTTVFLSHGLILLFILLTALPDPEKPSTYIGAES